MMKDAEETTNAGKMKIVIVIMVGGFCWQSGKVEGDRGFNWEGGNGYEA